MSLQLVESIIRNTPEPPARAKITDPIEYEELLRRRIARRVVVDPVTECWNWQGSIDCKGYGRIGAFRQKSVQAHRVSYTVFVGEIPDGLEIDHLCSNRPCVNPNHLEAVTHAENVRRGNTGITWASRTHCGRGHPFDEENTGWRPAGDGRMCRTCRREDSRKYKMLRKQAAA